VVKGVKEGVIVGVGVYAGLVGETGAVLPLGRGRQAREAVGDTDGEFVGGVGVDVGVDGGVVDGVVCPGSSLVGVSVGVCVGELGVGVGVSVGELGVTVGVEDGVVVSPGSSHPESEPLPLGVVTGNVGVDGGVVVPGSVGVGVGVGVGVYVGGATDAGADGVPDVVGGATDAGADGVPVVVGGATDPGVEGTRLGLVVGVGRELVGEEPPVVVALPVTNCAASAQNATNKLTSLVSQATCTKLSSESKKAASVQSGSEHV
jgi:hypothetical protein